MLGLCTLASLHSSIWYGVQKKVLQPRKAQWPIGYGVGLRIKRSSVRIRPWPLCWVLGQGSLLPLSQGEAFTLASISYLAILVKYILAKKKKLLKIYQYTWIFWSLPRPAWRFFQKLAKISWKPRLSWWTDPSSRRHDDGCHQGLHGRHGCWLYRSTARASGKNLSLW